MSERRDATTRQDHIDWLRDLIVRIPGDPGIDWFVVAQDLLAEIDRLHDAVSALRYIEQRYGRLDGVGWERVL